MTVLSICVRVDNSLDHMNSLFHKIDHQTILVSVVGRQAQIETSSVVRLLWAHFEVAFIYFPLMSSLFSFGR